MRFAFAHPTHHEDETLLTHIQLVHLGSDSRGCITHAGGIEKLMHARGPELHKSYPEKEIYLEARMILVRHSQIHRPVECHFSNGFRARSQIQSLPVKERS